MKCDDYHIMKVRYYADKPMLKFFHDDTHPRHIEAVKKHHARALGYLEFKWKFITKVTNIEKKCWHQDYGMFADECAFEYIHEKFGIICEETRDGWRTFLIPKKYTDLFEWCQDNLPNNPYVVLKRTLISFYNQTNEDLTWKREHYLMSDENPLKKYYKIDLNKII